MGTLRIEMAMDKEDNQLARNQLPEILLKKKPDCSLFCRVNR